MYIYELSDILFFIKSIQSPCNGFNITDPELTSFLTSATRSSGIKLHHKYSSNVTTLNSYFFDYLDFGILFPSLIPPSQLIQLKGNSYHFYGVIFYQILIPTITALIIFYACPCCKCASLPHTMYYKYLILFS